MGSMRFRRSVKIAPGMRLNVNKRSVGLSAGTRGARVSVNSSGRSTRSVGIPGTGLSYRSQTGPGRSTSPAGQTPAWATTPSRLLRHIVVWTAVVIAVLLALSGASGAAGAVIAVGVIGWFLVWLLGGVIDAAWAWRVQSKAAATVPGSSAPAVAAPPASVDEEYELPEANVGPDWLESSEWLTWDAPRDFVAGASHYTEAFRELAGKPRPHGYLVPVEVEFVREPTNQHDPNAWRAVVGGRIVGHLRWHLAAQLSAGLDPFHITSFTLCGVIRGGSLDAPDLSVYVWPDRRPKPGPGLEQVDDALGVPWPPAADEGADAPAVDQFKVFLGRAREAIDAGGPEGQVFDYLKAAADIAIANDDEEEREAAAAVAERLIRYSQGTEMLARTTRLKKRLEPKARSSKQAGAQAEERLTRLKAMLERGVISDDEYAAQRAAIIKQL